MQKPDIIFIVLDTQRADRLGAYGHQRDITPNLDRFAEQGALFEQAVSPAQWTIPSHASLFTGLYPTAHQVTQSSQGLSPDLPHLAEVLRDSGYQTVGFCNNPLVGILNNGFKRGFQTFYNYGGAFPSTPHGSSSLPWPLSRIVEGYTQFLRRISYPIQNFFGQSDLAFSVSLNAWLTPIWSRLINFKGQNERSVQDVVHYLQDRDQQAPEKPLFLFLNLMETHLPFFPPQKYVDQVAPYMRDDKDAQQVMYNWNREAYRWAAPLAEPLSALEDRVLHDMYDAEVAYQDDYLGGLLAMINGRSRDTLTIIVADHGDGLGEHGYFGHAFVAYEELVHVPMMIHWPSHVPSGERISTPVSTRRIFHTILDAAGQLTEKKNLDPVKVNHLTLLNTVNGRDPENGTAYSEIYPPLNFVRAIENHQPELLEPFRCLSTRRAVVKADQEATTTFKLIQVDDEPDELFDLVADPVEEVSLLAQRPLLTNTLNQQIDRQTTSNQKFQEKVAVGTAVEVEDDQLLQQLRGLGYID